jgi:hypothetical protein
LKKSEESKSKKIYRICQYWQPDANYEKCYLADITACGGNPERCDLPDSEKEAHWDKIFIEGKEVLK